MTKPKHTPGPWLYKPIDRIGTKVESVMVYGANDSIVIAQASPTLNKADARLIAAAPEMLEALYKVEQFLAETTRNYLKDHEIGRIVRIAINKAEEG